MLLHNLDNSFLASYRPARLRFSDSKELPQIVRPVWEALRGQENRLALRRGYKLLREDRLADETRAALLAALASAELDIGTSSAALTIANESLALYSDQWLAYRVLLTLHMTDRQFDKARRILDVVESVEAPAAWDEPLTDTDQNLLRAACSWMVREWDETAAHLLTAYPDGVDSMPSFLQEDWFRLAFYREKSNDAAEAARSLLDTGSPERADVLIQMLVRQGWHKEALRLYRAIYDQDPTNELLRRRVVGLCIREGKLQEARRLMELGALRLAV